MFSDVRFGVSNHRMAAGDHLSYVADFYENGCNNNLNGDQTGRIWECSATSVRLVGVYRKRERQTGLRVNEIMLRTCLKVIAKPS